jgi:7-cyano-7-deazaguanine synthase
MKKQPNKLLLYSGGLDSTALLYLKKREIKICVFFDYGSKHNKTEYEYAVKHCKKLNIKLLKIKISMPFKTALTSKSISEKGANNKATVVPFRNGIFLAYAVGLCEQHNLKGIIIGTNNPQETIYKDTTKRFIRMFDILINSAYDLKVTIENPLQGWSKKQIANTLYSEALVPPEETYSCYKGTKKPCGKCSACIKRKKI